MGSQIGLIFKYYVVLAVDSRDVVFFRENGLMQLCPLAKHLPAPCQEKNHNFHYTESFINPHLLSFFQPPELV